MKKLNKRNHSALTQVYGCDCYCVGSPACVCDASPAIQASLYNVGMNSISENTMVHTDLGVIAP